MNYDRYLKDIEQRNNPRGKLFTWNQMMGHRQQLAEGKEVEELQPRARHGICSECGCGKFRLKIVDHQMVRVCKGPDCGHEVIV